MGAHPSQPVPLEKKSKMSGGSIVYVPSDGHSSNKRSARSSRVLHLVGQGSESAHGVTTHGFGSTGTKEPIEYAGNIIGASKDQDRFVCVPELLKTVFFAAIFDGHGASGDHRADQASKYIPHWIQEVVRAKSKNKDGTLDIRMEQVKEAVIESFDRMQQKMEKEYEQNLLEPAIKIKKQIEEESEVDLGPLCLPQDGGTTATVVVVVQDDLLVSWVGDSRAVLARSGDDGKLVAVLLTRDHNVSNATPDEVERIKSLGGQLTDRHIGLDNVEGMLQLTRSLGDTPFHRNNVVQHTPEFFEQKVEATFKFIIIASDGLWDHYSGDEAIQFVQTKMRSLQKNSTVEVPHHEILHETTRALEEAALEKAKEMKVKSDDISVFIVMLRHEVNE